MSAELIVEFKRGTPESTARAGILGVGATVRRRMKTDSPDLVTLLVRLGSGADTKARISGLASVQRVEDNDGSYEAR